MKVWQACVLKAGIVIIAGFFFSDFFPTHHDGAGVTVAFALLAIQALIPTGDKTPGVVKEAAALIVGESIVPEPTDGRLPR